jgi:calcium permeable stress-gated cation channel
MLLTWFWSISLPVSFFISLHWTFILTFILQSIVWILYNIKNEMRHFIITRQQHLIERKHSKSVQANTILVTGVPSKYLTQNALFKLFNSLPGGVKKIWINRCAFIFLRCLVANFHLSLLLSHNQFFWYNIYFRNLKGLPDIYDRRLAACDTLESAETSLLKTATKLRLKAVQTAAKNGTDVEASNQDSIQVPESERPTHKLGFFGLWGEKVDSINWAREEIATCTQLLEEGREKLQGDDEEEGPSLPALTKDDSKLRISAVDEEGNPHLVRDSASIKQTVTGIVHGTASGATKTAKVLKERVVGKKDGGDYPPMNSAFVTFERQISAHLAVQVLAHHEPYRMSWVFSLFFFFSWASLWGLAHSTDTNLFLLLLLL